MYLAMPQHTKDGPPTIEVVAEAAVEEQELHTDTVPLS